MTTTLAPDVPASSSRPPQVQALLDRLEDPNTAAALHTLLDNMELLAFATTLVDGLLRRSETITDNLVASLAEARGAYGAGTGTGPRELLTGLQGAGPALSALLSSSLVQPQTVAALDRLGAAASEGLARDPERTGVRGLLAALRDPDTSRGLAQLLNVAKSLGRRAGG